MRAEQLVIQTLGHSDNGQFPRAPAVEALGESFGFFELQRQE